MKYYKYIAVILICGGTAFNANALTIDPAVDCGAGNIDCAALSLPPGPSNPAAEISTIESVFSVMPGLLSLLYKNDVGEGEKDGAPFDPWYETTYANTPDDPSGATIAWQGMGMDPSISCPECYLFVKGGRSQDPNVYIFNLGTAADLALWNGTDDLVLENFWPAQGAISHVAIYGFVSEIPVPAAFWLFGTALIGFIGISRRTRV